MNNAFLTQNLLGEPSGAEPVVDSAPVSVTEKAKAQKAPSAFRTISEVADDLDVQQHVLRFWETKFSQVRPLKRGGGRRYYRPEDVALLRRIHHLLYTEGYTIKGVQKLLKGQGKGQVMAAAVSSTSTAPASAPAAAAPSSAVAAYSQSKPAVSPAAKSGMSPVQRELLQGMLDDLKGIRDLLKAN